MVVKNYFETQRFCFACLGIDLEADHYHNIIKSQVLCYMPLAFAVSHCMAMIHYAYVHRHDYVEVTDSLSLFCQSLLAIWKMLVLLVKRKEFLALVRRVHDFNKQVHDEERNLIIQENLREVFLTRIYFQIVKVAAVFAFSNPILLAAYLWFTQHELILIPPYKATYFWPHDNLAGYSLVYIWNLLSIYNLIAITIGIDTLFLWLVSNISAQFHVLFHRLKTVGLKIQNSPTNSIADLSQCLNYHSVILKLLENLNCAYSVIIFIKFIVSCSQICCLAFRLSHPHDSWGVATYQSIFLFTVAMQLMLYCYNGQRIKDKSIQVSLEIYAAFDWSQLSQAQAKLFLLPLMRSQESSHLKGVFFALDLNLFLWVFKTAGSLITALKALDENQLE